MNQVSTEMRKIGRWLWHQWQNYRPQLVGQIVRYLLGGAAFVSVSSFINDVPARVLVTFLAIIFVILFAPWAIVRFAPWIFAIRVLRVIKCDAPLGEPDWTIGQVESSDKTPVQNVIELSTGKAVKISDRGPYKLDRVFDFPYTTATSVVFAGRFNDHSTLYVRLQAQSPEGRMRQEVFIKVVQGESPPEKYDKDEWIVSVRPSQVDDIVKLDLDIRSAFRNSFGRDTWDLYGVIGIRLRGSMTLAQVVIKGQ